MKPTQNTLNLFFMTMKLRASVILLILLFYISHSFAQSDRSTELIAAYDQYQKTRNEIAVTQKYYTQACNIKRAQSSASTAGSTLCILLGGADCEKRKSELDAADRKCFQEALDDLLPKFVSLASGPFVCRDLRNAISQYHERWVDLLINSTNLVGLPTILDETNLTPWNICKKQ